MKHSKERSLTSTSDASPLREQRIRNVVGGGMWIELLIMGSVEFS